MIHKKIKHLFFEVKLRWQPGEKAVFTNNAAKTTITAAEWHLTDRNNEYWSAEHLLLAAFITNYLETLYALLVGMDLPIVRFNSSVMAQVEIGHKSRRLVDINFYPEIVMRDEVLANVCKKMINTVQHRCLVANIIKVPVIHHTVVNSKFYYQ